MESDIEDIEEESESSTNFNIYQYKNSEYRILFISIMNLALALFDVIEKKDKDNFKMNRIEYNLTKKKKLY